MTAAPRYKVSVRELVEFTERRGDINFRFSTRSSALEGIRGHQRLQRSRDRGYVAERDVAVDVDLGDMAISLSGRVDGCYPERRPLEVEEIKTLRVPVERVPEAVKHLHWAQAVVYARLLAAEEGVDEVLVRLCYLNLDDDTEVDLEQAFSVEELEAWYAAILARYGAWLRGMRRWRAERDDSIGALAFPYDDYRAGQRDMAVSVYRALKEQTHLAVQAPTGIGKTMAALFPAVKALKELEYDKLFFLTAKTSGQAMVQGTVADMKAGGLRLRDVTLTAKEKICFSPGSPCDPEHCRYAAGYYDRLPDALRDVMEEGASLSREAIEDLGRRHVLCPFELSLDLSRVCDLVICDYNYVFDPTVYLRRYFDDGDGRYAFLVDESHNLVDRGRDMFSAAINKDKYLALRRDVTIAVLKKRLAKVNAGILAVRRPEKERFTRDGHLLLDEVPQNVLRALREFSEAAETWLDENRPAPFQPALLELYFESLRFIRTAEWFGDDYACLLERTRDGTVLRLYNLNPAEGLGRGLRRAASALCFSATLSPQPYFQQLMGLDAQGAWYRIGSPFDPGHLGVFTAPFISTAWRDRDASLTALADLVADVTARRRGNYLVFLPSHAYLDKLHACFTRRHAGVRCLRQYPVMSEEERSAFLAPFDAGEGRDTLVGFAVMGGVFGEGVDLRGTRLIGVIVVGVGLPGIGVERNLIRDYFDDRDARGFEFAYQFPGINRVLQTAGRVIRGDADRGIVCLVDRRFAEARYRRLLPEAWRVEECGSRASLSQAVGVFWDTHYGAEMN